MKKILFLLLCTVSIYGQTYQNPTYGTVKIKSNVATAETSKIVSQQPGTGELNYVNATNLPLSTAMINALRQKSDLSTGLLKNGLVTTNTSTTFNVTAGIGVISNFDDPENPTSVIVNFPAFNAATPAYLTTSNITYVAVNNVPALVMQATPFTDIQRRDLIVLGAVIHSNLSTINTVNNISAPTNAIGNQLHDLYEFIGALNLNGNKYSANGANLSLNKSAGDIGKLGVNFANNWKDPNKLNIGAQTALTFRYRTQNGTEGSDVTVLNPAVYDLNNVLTAVPTNRFTIQTVTIFQTGLTRIQYGQATYATMADAEAAILTRSFNVESNIATNGITRAYIILRHNATDLTNTTTSKIIEAQKFGGVASGGAALTLDAIISALGYTPENTANKTSSYTIASTTTYPNTTAVVNGLATKQNTLVAGANITIDNTNPALPVISSTAEGGGGGTVTSVSVTTANGVSGTVATATTTPAISLTLGAITPTSTNGVTAATMAFVDPTSSIQTQLNSKQPTLGGTGFVKSTAGTISYDTNTYLTSYTETDPIVKAVNGIVKSNGTTIGAVVSGTDIKTINGSSILGAGDLVVGGAGATNLAYTPSPTNGTVTSDTGTDATLTLADGTNAGLLKPADFTQLSTLTSDLSLKAPLASPALTGVPTAPTAAPATNTTQLATTAFVLANAGGGGTTDLAYVPAATSGTVTNSNGTGFTIPAAGTSAGLLINGAQTFYGAKAWDSSSYYQTYRDGADSSTGIFAYGVRSFTWYVDSFKPLFSSAQGNAFFAKVADTGVGLNLDTNLLTAARTQQVPDKNGTFAMVSDTQGGKYKVYTALLTQTGTAAPTAIVLENTLGGTVVWSRSAAGVYVAALTGVFTLNKTAFILTQTMEDSEIFMNRIDSDLLELTTQSASTGVYTDGAITSSTLEIRVYN